MRSIISRIYLLPICFICTFQAVSQNINIYERKGKFGAKNHEGEKIIAAKYDSINEVKIKSTIIVRAWTGNWFSIFNLSGKGSQNFLFTDFVPVTVYPNRELILTQSGGKWCRSTFGDGIYTNDLSAPLPPNAKGFATWCGGKRGIYDHQNGIWLLKPEYDDIIFPVNGYLPADSIVTAQPLRNINPAYYWSMNSLGELETAFNKLDDFPMITVKNNKFDLMALGGSKPLNRVSYDTIIYSHASNCFYGFTTGRIDRIDSLGKVLNKKYKCEQALYGGRYLLVTDSAQIVHGEMVNNKQTYKVISTNANDTSRLIMFNSQYERKILVHTNSLGIFDNFKNELLVLPDYKAFFFLARQRGVTYENKELPKGEISDGIFDSKFVSENLIPITMEFSNTQLNKINPDLPFWGLTDAAEYYLIDTSGKKISAVKAKKFKYVQFRSNQNFYILENFNGSYSLIDIFGRNPLKQKEYYSITETEGALIFREEKHSKEEKVEF